MGLDWLVADKQIPERVAEFESLQGSHEEAKSAVDENWRKFLSDSGQEAPRVYPNPIQKAWSKTPEYRQLRNVVDDLEAKMGRCVISSMETLGAPRVGFDEEATKFCVDQWEEYHKEKADISLEDHMSRSHGMYVPDLLKSDGLPGVGGIFVGSDSFRGKCLRFVEWLDDGLQNEAYEAHTPEELVDYGKRLLAAVEDYENQWVEYLEDAIADLEDKRSMGECGDDPGELEDQSDLEDAAEIKVRDVYGSPNENDTDIVTKAGKWCIFWGQNGHGMSPWY